MERTGERRRPTGGGRGKKGALPPRERRRLFQLAASMGLFLAVFVSKGMFPDQLSWCQAALGRDADFRGAFSDFGRAVSRGEGVWDTLGVLWVEVFAGGTGPVEADPAWTAMPSAAQRRLAQVREPSDPVSQWGRGARSRSRQPEASPAAEPAQAQPEGAQAVQAVQTAVQQPLATAVAQRYSPEGRALPGQVSLEYYALGLEETVTPVSAPLTSLYGFRDHPMSGEDDFHLGADLGAPLGEEVRAFAAGTVFFVGENDSYGKYLKIAHANGVSTIYAHCSRLLARWGQAVAAGETVALVGETGNATGPHLHFSVLKDGVFLDPLYYLELG